MSKLSVNTAHINNGFVSQNLGVMMGMLGVQYSGFYGENLCSKSSTCSAPVDNNMAVAL